MKTAMKKLLSFMLVAVLLVSAIPFRASASEGDLKPVTVDVNVYVDSNCYPKSIEVAPDSNIVLTEAYAMNDSNLVTKDGHKFVKWTNSSDEVVTGKDLPYSWLIQQTGYYLNLYLTDEVEQEPAEDTKQTYTITFLDAQGGKVYELKVEEGQTIASASDASGKYIEDYVKKENYNIPAGYQYVSGWEYNAHEPVNADRTYQVIYEKIPATYTLTLEANGGSIASGERKTYTYEEGTVVTLSNLTAPTRSGYEFAGWFTKRTDGSEVTQVTMTSDMTLYAHWTDYDTVKVTAIYYKNGVRMYSAPLLTWSIPYGDNAFEFIYDHKDDIRDRLPSNYTWGKTSRTDDDYFYNYNNDEELTEQNLRANGTKSVCVRFYSTEAIEADVQLYVHTKVGGTAKIFEMKDYGYGYTVGDEVTLSAATAVVKKNYTGSDMTVQGLYSNEAWKELCDGKNPTAATGVEITSNGTVKVHVIIKNATASSGTADTSNPKTGDSFYMVMSIMGLSAAALAVVYYVSKKRAF